MGERRQAGQTAAKQTSARRFTAGFLEGRNASSRQSGGSSEASCRRRSPKKTSRAAAGAARPPRAVAIVQGEKEIEARLDLHGMTQARAHRVLSGFLHQAHGDGLTFVLVITGKGKIGAETERGVLRRQVPQWLSQPEFRNVVVGFEEAHIGHGGAGALYVRIRRVRI